MRKPSWFLKIKREELVEGPNLVQIIKICRKPSELMMLFSSFQPLSAGLSGSLSYAPVEFTEEHKIFLYVFGAFVLFIGLYKFRQYIQKKNNTPSDEKEEEHNLKSKV